MTEEKKATEAVEEELKKYADTPHPEAAPSPEVPPLPHQKYPDNLLSRCKMRFYLIDGSEYQNEINIPMNRIELIQRHMSNSMENKDGNNVVYLQGSKNSEADFTIIPVKNVIYMQLEVEEIKTI